MSERERHRARDPRKGAGGRERRRSGRLWVFLGLTLVGLVTAVLSAGRRSLFDRRWDEVPDDDLAEPEPAPLRPVPSVPSEIVEVPGPAGKLFVDDGGLEGPAVVFVHGLAGSSRQWHAQFAHLRPALRAVAFDLRGHGDSAPGGEAYGLEGFADDLEAVVDHLDLGEIVLVAHSFGATVALDFAHRFPERIAGLLLVDPNGDQTRLPREEAKTFLEAVRKDPHGEMSWYFGQVLTDAAPEVVEQVRSDLALTDAEALPRALEAALDFSPLPVLESYQGPVLAVISQWNSLPYSLHNLIEDLPRRTIPGTSHWLMMDRPDEFNQVMVEFLASLEG